MIYRLKIYSLKCKRENNEFKNGIFLKFSQKQSFLFYQKENFFNKTFFNKDLHGYLFYGDQAVILMMNRFQLLHKIKNHEIYLTYPNESIRKLYKSALELNSPLLLGQLFQADYILKGEIQR